MKSAASAANSAGAAGLDRLAQTVDGIGPTIGSIVGGKTKADRRVTELVKLAHARNLVVHPYTVRSDELPKTVESVADLHAVLFREAGVDGVFTDFTDVTAAWLKGANLR
ncbi:MAG: hypothetical protein HY736_13565 [Verrucomicrobia bacterium]|nr:hypothetical protein [Verrucomicrobiota bacterium]